MIYKAGEILYGIKIYFAVSLYKLYSIPKSKSKRQTICIWKTITVTGGLMDKLYTDFSKTTGTIKPMHAINNGPYSYPGHDGLKHLFQRMQEAGIPYARLHDTGGNYGGSHFVDIPNVFPDFTADPEDEASYDFKFTDFLLDRLVSHGVQPFYRLGVTIENSHRVKPYAIYPPEDNLKWAKICEGIIRHYNEGWANGFRYDITYWEIWNEPDNEPEIVDNPMWKGTAEQYFMLYETASRYLKERFPSIKIGGYASCGFYALSDKNFSETAKSSTRVGYFVEFFINFLKYITQPEHRCPLDFFSWHSYADIEDNMRYAAYAKEKLTEYGFGDIEIIFNEWNPGIHNRGTQTDAANIAAMMCGMQKTSTDMCMYYDGQIDSSYCGIFDPIKKDIFPAYYAFYAFNRLYELGSEVFSKVEGEGLYICSAANGSESAALLVNRNNGERPAEVCFKGFKSPGKTKLTRFSLNGKEFTETENIIYGGDGISFKLTLPAFSVSLYTFSPV